MTSWQKLSLVLSAWLFCSAFASNRQNAVYGTYRKLYDVPRRGIRMLIPDRARRTVNPFAMSACFGQGFEALRIPCGDRLVVTVFEHRRLYTILPKASLKNCQQIQNTRELYGIP